MGVWVYMCVSIFMCTCIYTHFRYLIPSLPIRTMNMTLQLCVRACVRVRAINGAAPVGSALFGPLMSLK